MAESRGDASEEDLEGKKSLKRGEHDIHEDDTEFIVEEDGSDEEKVDGHGKFWMRGPTPVTELKARII